MSRRSFLPLALMLSACLVVLPACRKKKVEEEDGGGGGGSVPASASSDYLVFARVKVKDLRDSTVYTEITQALTKAGGVEVWDRAEKEMGKEIGIKPTDVDTVTAVVTDVPTNIVLIIESSKPINKDGAFGVVSGAKADGRGFYKSGGGPLVHYPNDKTAVVVSEALADQYLNGYAKNPSGGWPLTADLTRAAAGHTLFAVVNGQKIPRDKLDGDDARNFAGMLSAQKLTVTADLKGKEITLGARATFPDAASAAKAKGEAQKVLQTATGAVDEFANGPELKEFSAVKPVVAEAQRTLKNVRIDTAGADLTLSASYKADFDIGQIVAATVKKWKAEAPRMDALNDLRQIGLAMHNYASVYQDLVPIHGIGKGGGPLRRATDKPLLSWRVAILPYIEQDNLYKKFNLDEPWDSPNNIKLLKEMPKIFAPKGKPAGPGKEGFTHLQMVVGKGGTPIGQLIGNIPDGTSNTIAVIEAVDLVEWTKPADVVLPAKFAPGDLKKKFGGQFEKGILVAMWDGSVRMVPNTVSERTLQLALDTNDAEALPNDFWQR